MLCVDKGAEDIMPPQIFKHNFFFIFWSEWEKKITDYCQMI